MFSVRSRHEGAKVVSFSNAVKKREDDERSFKSDSDFSDKDNN